jgi:hypothetical protein
LGGKVEYMYCDTLYCWIALELQRSKHWTDVYECLLGVNSRISHIYSPNISSKSVYCIARELSWVVVVFMDAYSPHIRYSPLLQHLSSKSVFVCHSLPCIHPIWNPVPVRKKA